MTAPRISGTLLQSLRRGVVGPRLPQGKDARWQLSLWAGWLPEAGCCLPQVPVFQSPAREAPNTLLLSICVPAKRWWALGEGEGRRVSPLLPASSWQRTHTNLLPKEVLQGWGFFRVMHFLVMSVMLRTPGSAQCLQPGGCGPSRALLGCGGG